MNTLFYGNGFNRAIDNFPAWDSMLQDYYGENLDTGVGREMRNILLYEYLFFDKFEKEESSDSKLEHKVKQPIIKSLNNDPIIENYNPYQVLSQLDVDNYITTNYDNYLLRYLHKNNMHPVRDLENKEKETRYSIKRCYKWTSEQSGIVKRYWPIHGELNYTNSIMLGMDHYGSYLEKIISYTRGSYKHEYKEDEKIAVRLGKGIEVPISWVDLFFISNIHIVGYGLSDEEFHLWWLLTYRKRLMMRQKRDKVRKGLITNQIFYYDIHDSGEIDDKTRAKYALLEKLNVKVVEVNKDNKPFIEKYEEVLKMIDSRIRESR